MRSLYKFCMLTLIMTQFMIRAADLPQIEVFVESLCPDCIDFINRSFTDFQNNPDHQQLANVRFFPFGNGKQSYQDGKWVFTCQHGTDECVGNLYETCSLAHLDNEAGNNFMICFESGRSWDANLERCVTDENIRNVITECISSTEGNTLQHEVADHTPKEHQWVPWVTVNGVHDKNAEDQILNDMVQYLCSISEESLPGCNETHKRRSDLLILNEKRCMNPYSNNEILEFLQS